MTLELTFSDFLLNFLTALGVGGLVGLEREHRRDEHTQIIAGVRTFPLFSIAGYLISLLAVHTDTPLILAAALVIFGGFSVAFLWVRHSLGISGLTTPMAMVVTFLLGILIGYGFAREAIVVGVTTTFLLLTKQRLHRFAEVLSDEEIMSALQFIAVLFILFPIARQLNAPVLDQAWFGRGALVDPFVILVVVLFVSVISFVSFVAMRLIGPRRGVAVSGLLGGLVNSEAATVSLAQHAEGHPALVNVAVMGGVLATTAMIFRNAAIAAFTDPSLEVLALFAAGTVPMALAGAFYAWRKNRDGKVHLEDAIRVKSPFAIGPALQFAALFAVLSIVASLAVRYGGVWGVYLTAVGGLVSAGAVTASVAALHASGQIPASVAAQTAILATVAGAFNKIVILRAINRRVYARSKVPFTVMGVVGLAGFVALLAGARLVGFFG